MAVTLEDRFWSKVSFGGWDGCWLWTGAPDKDGYGRYTRQRHRPHRFAYELLVGPVPEGLVLDHVAAWGCGNPACVNPLHLEPVTTRENILRGTGPTAVNAVATECVNGHPFTEENTGLRPNGWRWCRECSRLRCERWRRSR